MENTFKITDEIYVLKSQPAEQLLQQAKDDGFRSILNLQSPDEEGFMPNEEQSTGKLGLKYVNVPVNAKALNDELATQVIQQIEDLPKPTLIHCASGRRSGALALMNIAVKNNWTPEQAFERAHEVGFNCDDSPQMKEFFADYVRKHTNFHSKAS